MEVMPTRSFPGMLAASTFALVITVAGCSSSNPKHGAVAPAEGRIASLPKYPDSTAAGPLSAEGGVRARSFLAFDVTPHVVVQWYEAHLNGWTEVGSLQTAGTQTVRGTWKKGDEQLQVSATPAPTTQHAGSGHGVQYDLLLRRLG